MTYHVEFSPEALEHIAGLRAHDRTRLLDAIARQLRNQPKQETRNRRPMRPNPVAQYRLRVGQLRVYYDVQDVPRRLVLLKAIGRKLGNRVYVGDKEVRL